jgi:hypothetical protein
MTVVANVSRVASHGCSFATAWQLYRLYLRLGRKLIEGLHGFHTRIGFEAAIICICLTTSGMRTTLQWARNAATGHAETWRNL